MRGSTLRRIAAMALFVGAMPSDAQDPSRGVRIGLRYDPGSKPGVLVLPISGSAGDSLRGILERDLDYSDRVTVVQLSASAGSVLSGGGTAGTQATLNYPLFATMAVVGVIQITPTTRGLHLVVHDVSKAAVANVREIPLPAGVFSREWRLAVHGLSDTIEELVTGQRGISQTRLAFVRDKVVRVIDMDGQEEQSLSTVSGAMSPSWNGQGTMLAYSTYGLDSRVFVHDFRSGRVREFGSQRNTTNLTPVFSPDGKSVVYTMVTESGADLFAVFLEGDASPRRVTVGRGAHNVSPTFSPDGNRLAFTSDRMGHPEVYIMDADGTNSDIFTAFDFGDQNDRCCPDWSPDGRQIAFQSRIDGRYQIFTMSLRDRQPRQLTSEGENEDPSWAPDGRHLVFASTRTGVRQLWILDTESGRFRQLTQVGGSQLPAWSPRLAPK